MLTGATLITHGFGGDAGTWVKTMADSIIAKQGSAINATVYTIQVTDPGHAGGSLAVSPVGHYGADPNTAANPEIFILLDWSDVAGQLQASFPNFLGYHRSTVDVAAAVTTKLLSSSFLPGFAPPVASLPLHLIGHSRGGSLVAELAKDLGQYGAWIDQVTMLDPHPMDSFSQGGDWDDSQPVIYDNVVFADNYWRADGTNTDPDGQFVSGAHDGPLTDSILEQAGYGGFYPAHADTHLWYHGTIGTAFSSDGTASVGANWYSAPHPSRSTSGFYFTRIAGGDRSSAPDGLWDIASNRTPLPVTTTGVAWDNVILSAYGNLTRTVGSKLSVTPAWGDGNGDAFITVGLDTDHNPYNGILTNNRETKHTANGVSFSVDTTGLNAGQTYYLYAKITNGTHTRYSYAMGSVLMTSTPATQGPQIHSVSPSTFAGKPLGQLRTITVSGTGFTPSSRLKFSDGVSNYFSDPARLRFINFTTLEYDISVGPNAATWSVQVLDAQNSDMATFNVTSISVGYDKTWNGDVSNNWNDPNNWTPTGLPQPGDTVLISGGNVNTSGFDSLNVRLSGGAALTWSGGDITGASTALTIGSGAALNITGTSRNWSGEVSNAGTINVNMTSGHALYAGSGNGNHGPLTINNLAGGVFGFQSDSYLAAWGNPLTFNNAGTLRKTGGTGATGLTRNGGNPLTFNNTGTVQATAGTLYFSGGIGTFYNEGVLNAGSGAAINLDSGGTFDAAGTSTGSGAVNLWGTLNGTLKGSSFVLNQFSAGAIILNGTMTWTGGDITGASTALTIGPGAALNITGTSRNWSGEVSNAGTINVNMTSGHALYAGSGNGNHGPLTINNLAGGVFGFQSDSYLAAWGNPLTFNNAGTLRKTGATGSSGVNRSGSNPIAFNNSGTVQVTNGILNLGGGPGSFYNEGILNAASGATINLAYGGTFDAAGTSAGAGTVNLWGTLNGTLNGSSFVLNDFSSGAIFLKGTVTWAGGDVGAGGGTAMTIRPGAVLNITGTTRNWSGEVSNAGTINVNMTSGHALYAGSGNGNHGPLTINNLAGGVFGFQSDSYLAAWGNPLTFNNAGTLRKTGGTGTSHLTTNNSNNPLVLSNSGVVQATTGTLYFSSRLINSGTLSGTGAGILRLATIDGSTSTNGLFTFEGGGVVSLQGYLTLSGNQTGTGAGFFSIDGGLLRVQAGDSAVLNFGSTSVARWNGGTVAADGSLTNRGTFNWTDGNLQGNGYFYNTGTFDWSGGSLQLSVTNTSPSFSISGTGSKNIHSLGALVNAGYIQHNDNGSVSNNGGTITNLVGATYEFTADGSTTLEFNNYGTLRKSAGGSTSSVGSPFRNFGTIQSDSGNIALNGFTQYSGSTILNGGNVSGSLTLQGGELKGIGSITGGIDNVAGVIRPGLPLGYLIVSGSYTQRKTGRIEFEIGGTLQGFTYDRFEVTGGMSLDGTLQSSFVGGYVPSSSAVFNLIFHQSRSGQFSTMTLAPSGSLRPSPMHNATGISLRMTSDPALLVTAGAFTGGSASRLTLQFSDDVSASLVKGDVSIVEMATGLVLPQPAMALAYASGTNTATWTFPGYPSGILPAGNYRATMAARSVQNAAGFELDSDKVVYFVVGQGGADSFYLRRSFDGSLVEAFVNVPTSAPPSFTMAPVDVAFTTFDLASGNDTLTLGAGVPIPMIRAGTGNHTLNLVGGTFALDTDLGGTTSRLSLTVSDGAAVLFNATQHLAALTLSSGARAIIKSGSGSVLHLGGLSIGTGAALDVADGAIMVDGAVTAAASIRSYLQTGRNGGAWNGAGIFSSASAQNASRAVGYADASALGLSTFGGQPVAAGMLLLKYAHVGDANLDGRISADDFSLADRGRVKGLGFWTDGDFNYDGAVTSADLAMLNGSVGMTQAPAPVTAVVEAPIYTSSDSSAQPDTVDPISTKATTTTNPAPQSAVSTPGKTAVKIVGPTRVRHGKVATLSLSALGGKSNTPIRYAIDWNGDGRVDQYVTGRSTTRLTHKFGRTGLFNVTVHIPAGDIKSAPKANHLLIRVF